MKLSTGGKGKSFNDRELAAEVRTLTLEEIKKSLQGNDIEFKKAVILRLAGSILPRLVGGDPDNPFIFQSDEESKNKANKLVKDYLGDTTAN